MFYHLAWAFIEKKKWVYIVSRDRIFDGTKLEILNTFSCFPATADQIFRSFEKSWVLCYVFTHKLR